MKKKYNVIDLFAGCGGLSEGFLQSGRYNFLAHIEWEMPMVETLRNNLNKRWGYSEEDAIKSVIRFDVQKTDELFKGNWTEESKRLYASDNSPFIVENGLDGLIGSKNVDVIIGGPPCQAYSLAGRAQSPNSMKDDYRNYLFESFVKVVDRYKPKVFVFENVPGILSAKPGDKLVINRIYDAFENIGYEIRNPKMLKNAIYSSADFESPQERHRVIIFGVRKDFKNNVEEFYTALSDLRSSKPKKTVRDAIGDLPKFKPLENSQKVNGVNVSHVLLDECNIDDHEARYNNLRDIEVFKKWVTNDMNKYSTEKKLKFYTEVIEIKKVNKGEIIGYKGMYDTSKDVSIAILPYGFADFSFINKSYVYINNKKYDIVVNYMDITAVIIDESVSLGDRVEIFGENISIRSASRLAGVNVYKLLTSITNRVPRIYKYKNLETEINY